VIFVGCMFGGVFLDVVRNFGYGGRMLMPEDPAKEFFEQSSFDVHIVEVTVSNQ